ncbi:MAG TPA: Ig-like domain-containing protein [Myxococcota bacterium]
MTFRGRSLLLPLVVTPLLVVATGCGEDVTADRTAPRVLSVAPASPIVPVRTSFTLGFSEVIDGATVDDDPTSDTVTVVIAPRDVVTPAFISDFNSPGIIESRQDDVVPLDAVLDGDTLTITPEAPLKPRTAYALLVGSDVRDLASNPLVDGLGLAAIFRYDFETDAGAPEVARTDVGTGLVAPNRRRFAVTFNQPVRNVGAETVSFSPAIDVESVLLDQTRTIATIFIADGAGCERFTPATDYTLRISDGVVADTDQTLVPFSVTFSTGASCDTVEHRLVGAPQAIAGEVSATVRFDTNKPSTTLVRYGIVGGPLDCLGNACPVVGAATRLATPESSPPSFLHALDITGLEVDRDYRVVVSAEDDVGHVASGAVSFTTAALPKLAVNEVMANPSASFNPEAKGEFVELANFGDVEIDAAAWTLDFDGGDCIATLPAPLLVPAGGFVVVAGKDFDPAPYALEADVVVVKLVRGTSNGMCSLVNSRSQPVVLKDASGRPVNSMAGYASVVPSKDGRSVERTQPEAPDVEASFCYSRTDAGPSPGRVNGVTISGCE